MNLFPIQLNGLEDFFSFNIMAKKVNLTPQRKAELKNKVLEALDNGGDSNKINNSINHTTKEEIKPMVKPKTVTKSNSFNKSKLPKASSVTSDKKIKQTLVSKTSKIANVKSKAVKKTSKNNLNSKVNAGVVREKTFTTKNKEKTAIMKNHSANEIENLKTEIDWNDIFPPQVTTKKKSSFSLSSLPKFSESPTKPTSIWKKNKDSETKSFDIFSQTTKEAKNKNEPSSRWLRLATTLTLALVLVILFDVLGIYKFNFNDPFSYQVMKAFKLPAGIVNENKISLVSYRDDLKFLSIALAKKREGLPDLSAFNDISDKVFYRQAANILVHQKLLTYNKRVSNELLNNQINILINQSGGLKQAESTINAIYGLRLSQFKEMILRPLIEREFLQESIVDDESLEINKQAKEKAETILKIALTEGVDFNALASQYTDDEVGVNTGGDLGWALKGQLDPTWEEDVFNLKDNEILPKVIKNKFGYHIIKVEKKILDSDTGKESVKLRHVLIKIDVDKYIKEILDQAKIKRYVN